MAQIVQYEAPASATDFQPKMEGINALQTTSEQLRRVALQSSQIAHQTGQVIDKGITELGTGVSTMEAAAKKQTKQAEALAAHQSLSDLEVTQALRRQQEEKDASPLDTQVSERGRIRDKAERDALLGTIKDPELRAEVARKNGELDVHDVNTSIETQSRRAVNAFTITADKTLANDLDGIRIDPSTAFRKIETADADMLALIKNSPGLDAATAQTIATEYAHKRKGLLAQAALEEYAKRDPVEAEKQMKPGGLLHPLLENLTPAQLEKAHSEPETQTNVQRAADRAKRADAIQAAADKDNSFLDKQTLQLYEGGVDQQPRNVARAHKETLEAMQRGDISPSAGNSFLGAIDKMQNQVEIGKEEATFNDMIRRHGPDYEGGDKITSEAQVWDLVSKGQLSFKRGKDFVDTFLKPGRADPAFAEQSKSWRTWGQEQLNHGNKADINGSARANEFARWYDDQVKRFGGDTSKFELGGPFYKLMVQKIQQLQHPTHQPASPQTTVVEPGKRKPISELLWGSP